MTKTVRNRNNRIVRRFCGKQRQEVTARIPFVANSCYRRQPMQRLAILFGALMFVLSVWTGSAALAAQPVECVAAFAVGVGHFEGDRDEAPSCPQSGGARHHTGCERPSARNAGRRRAGGRDRSGRWADLRAGAVLETRPRARPAAEAADRLTNALPALRGLVTIVRSNQS